MACLAKGVRTTFWVRGSVLTLIEHVICPNSSNSTLKICAFHSMKFYFLKTEFLINDIHAEMFKGEVHRCLQLTSCIKK